MSTPTLLVLGAGEDQASAYLEARRRGLRTVGVDMRPDATAVGLADRFLAMTTRDADGIDRSVRDDQLVGVIAPASDAAIPTAREIALRRGLPEPTSARAAECSVNKTAFRAVVEELGQPAYFSVTSADTDELIEAARSVGGRAVVKPADSSGSKGVAVVCGDTGVAEAIIDARAVSVSGQIMVEEYVDGRPLAVEAFLSDGRPELCLVAERSTTGPPHMITTTHWAPARLPAGQLEAIHTLIGDVAARIEHPDGPLNVDLVLTADGTPWMIEMGARLGGNGMPQLVGLAHGVDTVAAAVDHACGVPFDVTPTRAHAAATYILHVEQGGRLEALQGVERLARLAQVVDFQLFASPGDAVRPYTRAAHKLGYVLLSDSDEDRLHRAVEDIRRGFAVRLQGEVGARGCECRIPGGTSGAGGGPRHGSTPSSTTGPALVSGRAP